VRDGELTGKPPPLEPNAVAELRRLREVEKQFKRLQMEHDLLKKSYPVWLATKSEVFPSSRANRQTYPIQMMCALYRVTRFYAWQRRLRSERSQQDVQLLEQVRVAHET
jgi:hypothetical protein